MEYLRAFAVGGALCVLAQMVPPSALGGYFAQELTGEPRYMPVLKMSVVPFIVCVLFSMVELAFANKFAALFAPF